MSLKRIRKEAPIYLSEHRQLLNNLRTMLQLEGLITKHSDLMLSFGVSHLPDLLAQCAVPLVRQFDLVLGLRAMDHRFRDKLAELYDPEPAKRHELQTKIRKVKERLNLLYRSPLTTFAEHEQIKAEIAQLHAHHNKLELDLAELPQPAENGYLETIFTHVDDSTLEAEGFITDSGQVLAPYRYHLTEKSITLISQILSERDRIRGLLNRRQPIDKGDVSLIWHDVRKLMPIQEVN